MKLDKKDRALLALLQADATLTLRQLAERLPMSQASVWRRTRDLEAAGVIGARVTLVDPRAVGLGVRAQVQVDIADHGEASREAFEHFVRDRPEILECYSVTGPHDYLLTVLVRDVEAFEAFLMHHLLAHPVVSNALTNFILRQLKYTTAVPLGDAD